MSSTRILFFGTPEFSAVGLQALRNDPRYTVRAVVTQPDRPAGRGQSDRPSPVKAVARENGIPVLQPRSLRKELPVFLEEAKALGPFDIGVVIAFGQILPQPVLDLPEHGCVNVHASLLPRWRGAAPLQRALLAGDEKTGVCLMQMEIGLDTGGVFSCLETPLHSTTTLGELHDTLASSGARLLVRDLEKIARGELGATPQPETGVTYAQKISNEEAAISWAAPAVQIERHIRAFNPVPGAYTTLAGKRLKIFRARVDTSLQVGPAVPGQIEVIGSRLRVNCGAGRLYIEEAQLEGKRRMEVSELLRGFTVSPGLILGDTVVP